MNKDNQNINVQNSKNSYPTDYNEYIRTHKLTDTQKIAIQILKVCNMYPGCFVPFVIMTIMAIIFCVTDISQVSLIPAIVMLSFDSVWFFLLDFMGIILVVNQIKLEKITQKFKNIWILYFLGLFLIIPSYITILVMRKTYRRIAFESEKKLMMKRNLMIMYKSTWIVLLHIVLFQFYL